MKQIYAVLDTNVLVSALLSGKPDTATVQVLEALLDKKFVPLLSEKVLDEYFTVLQRPKFSFPKDMVQKLLDYIKGTGEMITPVPSHKTLPDPTDLPFYEIYLSRNESFLITGNLKHFPQESFIVTPKEFLRILSKTC